MLMYYLAGASITAFALSFDSKVPTVGLVLLSLVWPLTWATIILGHLLELIK